MDGPQEELLPLFFKGAASRAAPASDASDATGLIARIITGIKIIIFALYRGWVATLRSRSFQVWLAVLRNTRINDDVLLCVVVIKCLYFGRCPGPMTPTRGNGYFRSSNICCDRLIKHRILE